MTKFLNLLQSGKNAHLVFETHDDQACVSVNHTLGREITKSSLLQLR